MLTLHNLYDQEAICNPISAKVVPCQNQAISPNIIFSYSKWFLLTLFHPMPSHGLHRRSQIAEKAGSSKLGQAQTKVITPLLSSSSMSPNPP